MKRVCDRIEQCGIAEVNAHGSFVAFGLEQSRRHAEDFRARPLHPGERLAFEAMAGATLAEQERMERGQSGSFDEYIRQYAARTPSQLCAGAQAG